MEYDMKQVPMLQRRCRIPIFAALMIGLIFSICLPAETVNYTYDLNGRLLTAEYGGGKKITYTYDKAGNLLTETVVTSSLPSYNLQANIYPSAGGTVSGNGLNCSSECSVAIGQNQSVSLTATALSGYRFLGWGGSGSGNVNPISFLMDGAKHIKAYFGANSGTTVASKGLTDAEQLGPNGNNPAYDGNGDGTADYLQGGVASFHSTAGSYVTLAVPAGLTLANVHAVGNPSAGDAPKNTTFPYGFFDFTIQGLSSGGCTTLTLYLPKNASINNYYKYGPTPDNHSPHWYSFLYNGSTGAQIVQETAQTRIVLYFCDGQRGDDLLTADGAVIDQGGPSETLQTGNAVTAPTLSEWGMIGLFGILGLTSLYFLRRREDSR